MAPWRVRRPPRVAAPVPLCSADGHRAESSQFYSPGGSGAPAGSEGGTGGPGGGVSSRSRGPGCAWCSGQWGQGPRRSEVRCDRVCFGACGWEVRGALTLAGAGGRLCCTSVGVSPVSRVNQGCEQEWFLSLPQPPAVSPSGRLHWVSHSFLFVSRPKELSPAPPDSTARFPGERI